MCEDSLDGSSAGSCLESERQYICLHCKHVFLGREARPDAFGGTTGCARQGCGACALGLDVFAADDPFVTGEGSYDVERADDFHFRDELLGIASMTDVDDIARFDGLDVRSLAGLFELRVIDPDARQNRAPSAIEVMAFLCRWPELRAHGYALHPEREGDGGAVRIEGVSCEAGEYDEPISDATREAFRGFSRGADVIVDEPGALYCWWD